MNSEFDTAQSMQALDTPNEQSNLFGSADLLQPRAWENAIPRVGTSLRQHRISRAHPLWEPAIPLKRSLADRLFPAILLTTAALFIGAGMYMSTIEQSAQRIVRTITRIPAEFFIQETKTPKVKKVKRPLLEKPLDLTDKPELAQKEDDKQQSIPAQKPTRRVYGLRKVYSKGLGSGRTLADAVVGKLGNTMSKEIDTITAAKQNIKGAIVSTTTVTQAPRFKKRVRPEYTKEMLKSNIEGLVKVKVLVDIDGKVKKAIVLSDIGCNSSGQAIKASLAMEFFPALRGEEPVAVWIIVPIRFVMLG